MAEERATPRLIDIPIEQLPYVDEHYVDVSATDGQTWEALLATLPHAFDTGFARRVAPLVGAAHTRARGDPGAIGSSLPGFLVARAVAPSVLALLGQHRYSRYALVFRIERTAWGSRIRAETRAEFPGVGGRAYRALVIGTRGHVVVLRRLLRAVKRRAQTRPTPASGLP